MLAIAILAAGKGTRMKSDLPKVLHKLSGKTLLQRVLECCDQLKAVKRYVIVGHQGEIIKSQLKHLENIEFITQSPQKGTGHAIQQLIPCLKDFEGDLIVLNGDVPLLRPETIKELVKKHQSSTATATILSANLSNPKGYGRVFANSEGLIEEIIEQKDCNNEESKNTLVNAGIYCFKWLELRKILPKLDDNNSQKEIYITDTLKHLTPAIHIKVESQSEILGVNDRVQLSYCEEFIQNNIKEYWMRNGVSFIDPKSCTVSEECKINVDTIIEPQTHLRGKCSIGKGCVIGPGSLLTDVIVGSNVRISYSVLNNCNVQENVEIGPFANIRANSFLSESCKIGNFVETKNSKIGIGTKVNHLSYIGDSELGKKVNIGAGTITANYDGINKHKTYIGDSTKTGANSVLVAPITLGSNVTVGAGSIITKDVKDGSLAIARAKQLTRDLWRQE